MAYRISQGSGPRRVFGIIVVVLLHVGFFIGLQLGLVQKAITEVETVASAVKEPPPPPPEATPPPPPPPVEEPPPFVPPPDIVVATTTTSTNAIQQVTQTRPPPDRAPVGTNITKPEYPPQSAENCEQGSVTMTLSINERGEVTDVKLANSSGFPALDNSALSAARHWRFAPARKDGRPYATDYTIKVTFQLKDPETRRAYEECKRAGKVQ